MIGWLVGRRAQKWKLSQPGCKQISRGGGEGEETSNLNVLKSERPDNLRLILLRKLACEIASPLANISNESIK